CYSLRVCRTWGVRIGVGRTETVEVQWQWPQQPHTPLTIADCGFTKSLVRCVPPVKASPHHSLLTTHYSLFKVWQIQLLVYSERGVDQAHVAVGLREVTPL